MDPNLSGVKMFPVESKFIYGLEAGPGELNIYCQIVNGYFMDSFGKHVRKNELNLYK